MLRELYVAVTRAKRRVVILIKQKDSAMLSFFQTLNCDLESVDEGLLRVEFDSETKSETWLEEGLKLFENHQFKLAASCFVAAKEYGWSSWARGRHSIQQGLHSEAVGIFRKAARWFHESADYTHTLILMREIARIPPWDPSDNEIFDSARLGGNYQRTFLGTKALKCHSLERIGIL
jgi:hypothetical protein